MPTTRREKRFAASVLSVLGALALLLALLNAGAARALAQDDEEEPEPITVEVMAAGIPSTVDGLELTLRKVTFQPGALLRAHRHPGALAFTVVEGELAYTLFEGEASIQRAGEDGEPGPVEPFVLGEEAILNIGDSVFEEDVLHQAENKSDAPTILWVSALLTEGEPFVHLEEAPAAEPNVVEVELNEFDIVMPSEIPAGPTTFEITNTGTVAHSFFVGGDVGIGLDDLVGPGATASLTVDLAPGEYEVICPVANHAALGMTATLTVVEAEGDAEPADEADDAEVDDEEAEEAEDDQEAAAEPAEVTVDIAGFAFDPGTIEVTPGTTVTWTNSDSAPHTVTSDDGTFDSGRLEPGDSFSFTFEQAGSFAYHCDFHPNMTATVEVAEADAEDEGDGADEEDADAEPEEVTVDIAGFAFDPGTVEIEAGTTVTWVNNDSAPHTVTSDDGAFDSGRLAPGDSFSFTFEDAGSFAYHCDLHPSMTAVVVVAEAEDEDDADSAATGDQGGEGETVEIDGFAFRPETLEIEAGTTVTWVNNDQAPHTVTSDDGVFDSGRLEPGDSFSFTFAEAASFAYHCDIHPRMTATVEVS